MSKPLQMREFPALSCADVNEIRKTANKVKAEVFNTVELISNKAYLVIINCTEKQEAAISNVAKKLFCA